MLNPKSGLGLVQYVTLSFYITIILTKICLHRRSSSLRFLFLTYLIFRYFFFFAWFFSLFFLFFLFLREIRTERRGLTIGR